MVVQDPIKTENGRYVIQSKIFGYFWFILLICLFVIVLLLTTGIVLSQLPKFTVIMQTQSTSFFVGYLVGTFLPLMIVTLLLARSIYKRLSVLNWVIDPTSRTIFSLAGSKILKSVNYSDISSVRTETFLGQERIFLGVGEQYDIPIYFDKGFYKKLQKQNNNFVQILAEDIRKLLSVR